MLSYEGKPALTTKLTKATKGSKIYLLTFVLFVSFVVEFPLVREL
jgi:hypothetical protein